MLAGGLGFTDPDDLARRVVVEFNKFTPDGNIEKGMGSGVGGVAYVAIIDRDRMGVRVKFKGREAMPNFRQIYSQRDEIKRELGFEFDWRENPERVEQLAVYTEPADLENTEAWDDYISWTLGLLHDLTQVLTPRLRDLR